MNESSPAVNLGIVGLSSGRGWAAIAHVPALESLTDFQVHALVASTNESAKRSADHHEVLRHFGNINDLAACSDVDLIVVAVKTPDHYAAVDVALRAGKSVYCEWPLGNGLTEAEHHWALAKSNDIRTFIGLQGRAAPAIRQPALKDIPITSENIASPGSPRDHYYATRYRTSARPWCVIE